MINTMTIVFYTILFFFLVYFIAFEYSRYKLAGMLARGLGGKAVYRIHGSYMKRDNGRVEERAWVKPDDKMAWGSIWSIIRPSTAVLFLQRRLDTGFSFRIEPKTNVLVRPMRLSSLKSAYFNVPELDDILTLHVGKPAEASARFLPRERHDALVELFSSDFTELSANRNGILATKKGVTEEDLRPEKIDLYLKYLRAF